MHVAPRCARQSAHSICIRLKFQQIALVARIAFGPSAIEQATQLDNVLINYTTEWVSDPHFVVFLLLLLWLGKKGSGGKDNARADRCSTAGTSSDGSLSALHLIHSALLSWSAQKL